MKNVILVLISTLMILGFSSGTFAKSNLSGKQTVQEVSQQKTVNLNKADAKEIAKILKGIGMKKAQSIVAYRNKNGRFNAVEEVASVKGIGVKTIAKNHKRIIL